MSKAKVLKVLNPLLGVSLIAQVISGAFVANAPFREVHETNAWILLCAAVAHLILNGNWVVATYFRRPASPAEDRRRA